MKRKNDMMRVLGWKLVAAMLTGLLSVTLTAEEMSNEGRLHIIEDITAKKLAEAKGGNADIEEILAEVGECMPLDIQETTPELEAIIAWVKRKVRAQYPATDQELSDKYNKEANRNFPVYKKGDKVTVVYYLAGKKFTVSGTYYRSSSSHVWVGSKQIPRRTLAPEYAPRFDDANGNAARRNYVLKEIAAYHRMMADYEKRLLSQESERIELAQNKVKFNGKWMSARETVQVMYTKMKEVRNILNYCSQPEISPMLLKNQYGIDLSNGQMLGLVKARYLGIPNSEKLLDVLNQYQLIVMRNIIQNGIQEANAARTYQDAIAILNGLLQNCPGHVPELALVRNRLQELQQKLASQRQTEERRYSSNRSSNYRRCADCRGNGFIEKYINGRWIKYRCGSCGGTGDAGDFGEYIDNNGRHRAIWDQKMGQMFGTGGGGVGGIFR